MDRQMRKNEAGWIVNEHGAIFAYPVTRIQAGTLNGQIVVMVQWEEETASGEAKSVSTQVYLPPVSASELADELHRLAPKAPRTPAGTA
jgi:hypothetical protein